MPLEEGTMPLRADQGFPLSANGCNVDGPQLQVVAEPTVPVRLQCLFDVLSEGLSDVFVHHVPSFFVAQLIQGDIVQQGVKH